MAEYETFINKANHIIENKAQRECGEAVKKVNGLVESSCQDEVTFLQVVVEANSWIDFLAGSNDALYEFYKFRVFRFKNKLYIAQGLELNTDSPTRKKDDSRTSRNWENNS